MRPLSAHISSGEKLFTFTKDLCLLHCLFVVYQIFHYQLDVCLIVTELCFGLVLKRLCDTYTLPVFFSSYSSLSVSKKIARKSHPATETHNNNLFVLLQFQAWARAIGYFSNLFAKWLFQLNWKSKLFQGVLENNMHLGCKLEVFLKWDHVIIFVFLALLLFLEAISSPSSFPCKWARQLYF